MSSARDRLIGLARAHAAAEARGDVVATLAGRVPGLYVAALGALKNGSIFTPLYSAFGPDPIVSRMTIARARVLVTAADPLVLARRIVDDKLTVRQAEALAQGLRAKPARRNGARGDSGRDADTLALERRLSAELGLSVSIEHKRGAKGGSLVIRYQTLDQLDDLLARLSRRA